MFIDFANKNSWWDGLCFREPVLDCTKKKKKWMIKNHRSLEGGYQVVLGRTLKLHSAKGFLIPGTETL